MSNENTCGIRSPESILQKDESTSSICDSKMGFSQHEQHISESKRGARRAIIIVLDSVGIGELPDADQYGDVGSNTLGNIATQINSESSFGLANLEKLGLGNIDNIRGINKNEDPIGCYARMGEKSPGKDTTTGHWEIAGVILERAFPTYPSGFPEDIIKKFEEAIGKKTLGNIAASGTEIINRLGEEHLKTGYPIVYTSADSVFQIAAHEGVIPIETLYDMCVKARNILTGVHAVGRVIARPFEGSVGDFKRTQRRKDFSLSPTGKTLLNYAVESNYKVKAVGKIEDIFNGSGITHSVHTSDNSDGIDKTLNYIKESFEGIIFTNLVDFDMVYGHRNDVCGYAKALKQFDDRLPEILSALSENDILFITADHGCDPTTKGTDHTREYVPVIVYGKKLKRNVNLGVRSSFADIAATVSEFLGIDANIEGDSFYKLISY